MSIKSIGLQVAITIGVMFIANQAADKVEFIRKIFKP